MPSMLILGCLCAIKQVGWLVVHAGMPCPAWSKRLLSWWCLSCCQWFGSIVPSHSQQGGHAASYSGFASAIWLRVCRKQAKRQNLRSLESKANPPLLLLKGHTAPPRQVPR
jgi:hypothetical protein